MAAGRHLSGAASVVGSLAAIGIGFAMIPFREPLGSVNVALVMAALIVLSAEFGAFSCWWEQVRLRGTSRGEWMSPPASRWSDG
jgi:hypothetical protein